MDIPLVYTSVALISRVAMFRRLAGFWTEQEEYNYCNDHVRALHFTQAKYVIATDIKYEIGLVGS